MTLAAADTAEDVPATLPDNLSVTVSKGDMTTDTGPSSRVNVSGDCPSNGGGLRLHLKWAEEEEWSLEDLTISNAIPPEASMNLTATCGDPGSLEVSKISVDVMAPGEEWDVRVFAWRDGEVSDFSQVYYVIGWSVPEAPTGVSVTPGIEQLAVKWNEIVAAGTDMPVTANIRWRTAQAGQPGETDYAAAGPWNNDDGVMTDGPASHTITGLATGAAYDVEVSAASPMGSSGWVRARSETLSAPSGNDGPTVSASIQIPTPAVAFEHHEISEVSYWASVNEGDELTVTLNFTPAIGESTSIRWYTTSHHGEHASAAEQFGREESAWLMKENDYILGNNTARDIQLTPGTTTATFTVKTIDDSEVEGLETFHLHLCGPPPRCEWPFPPPEPHLARQRIIDELEASKDDYQDVANGPELLVTIVDDDEPEN